MLASREAASSCFSLFSPTRQTKHVVSSGTALTLVLETTIALAIASTIWGLWGHLWPTPAGEVAHIQGCLHSRFSTIHLTSASGCEGFPSLTLLCLACVLPNYNTPRIPHVPALCTRVPPFWSSLFQLTRVLF